MGRAREFAGMVREMAAWNRRELEQGRVRAAVSAVLDTWGCLYWDAR